MSSESLFLDTAFVLALLNRRDRPEAELKYAADSQKTSFGKQGRKLGQMRDSVRILGDIVSPFSDETDWRYYNFKITLFSGAFRNPSVYLHGLWSYSLESRTRMLTIKYELNCLISHP